MLKLVFIVHPRTYRRWLERRSHGEKPAKKMGRKGTSETIRQIVVRLAKENGWGYGRIVGELRKLRTWCGISTSKIQSDSTVYSQKWALRSNRRRRERRTRTRSSSAGLGRSSLNASTASSRSAWDISTISYLRTATIITLAVHTSEKATSRCSAYGQRSMIRPRKTTRSPVDNGSAACSSTTSGRQPNSV